MSKKPDAQSLTIYTQNPRQEQQDYLDIFVK